MEFRWNRRDRFAGRVSLHVWTSAYGAGNRILHRDSGQHRGHREEAVILRRMTLRETLRDGVAVVGGVAAGGMVLELAFDVGEHAAGAETEEIGLEPGWAEFVF